MFTCFICHFAVELDDAILPTPNRHCVCLRCYLRETGQERPLPKALRREIEESLTALAEAA